MKPRQWIIGIVLLLLMAAAVGGMLWTRELPEQADEASAAQTKKTFGRKAAVTEHPLVDQRPLLTAQRMGTMASTPEEQALAHEAAKVGDHEVDLAFFDALRTAQQNPPAAIAELPIRSRRGVTKPTGGKRRSGKRGCSSRRNWPRLPSLKKIICRTRSMWRRRRQIWIRTNSMTLAKTWSKPAEIRSRS